MAVKVSKIIRVAHERKIERIVESTIEDILKDADSAFARTHSTWEHSPLPVIEQLNGGSPLNSAYFVGREGQIYGLVSTGARRHQITGNMFFQNSYSAKTSYGILDAKDGGSSGSFNLNAIKEVDHPGFEGRDFASTVLDAIDDDINKSLKDLADAIAAEIF